MNDSISLAKDKSEFIKRKGIVQNIYDDSILNAARRKLPVRTNMYAPFY